MNKLQSYPDQIFFEVTRKLTEKWDLTEEIFVLTIHLELH